MKKPELLAPAGDMEKLRIALHYGADAVYLSGERYGLRAAAENFSLEDMADGVTLAHKKGVRVYLALNIFAHNGDIESVQSYLRDIKPIGFDAIIASDPGIISSVKETLPEIELHLSTQANTTNWRSVRFWKEQGISRVCVARELSIREIREIKEKVDGIEIEAFVHGAMCISYSGRCLISSYMTGRSANRGDCAHPCRYRYALVEETRPGEYFPVEEDGRGTYMMSSKDLCMIKHLDKMADAGIDAFKIEGRTKGIAYVGNVVRVYREAVDRYIKKPSGYTPDPRWMEELKAVSNREYTTGFYLDKPAVNGQNYLSSSSYGGGKDFVGIVRRVSGNEVMLEVRNRIKAGETLEFVGANKEANTFALEIMNSLSGEPLLTANPGMTVILNVDFRSRVNDMVRRHAKHVPSL